MKGGIDMDFASFDSQEIPGGGWVVTTYTVYVSPYLVYNGNGYSMDSDPDRFTKHYYAGSERIASRLNRIGQSATSYNPVSIYSPNVPYEPVLVNLQAALSDFGLNDQLDAAPAPHPENPILEIPDCDSQFGYDALEIERCKCIHFWEEAIGQSINCPDYEPIYWYHPDYLGHTDFVTDRTGQPYQHFFYAPFGEALLSQHTGTGYYNTPYRFNAKELDSETGFVYYGARYYEPKESVWLSVDPLAHKYPGLSGYNFVANNPIMLVDPDGREVSPIFSTEGKLLGTDSEGWKGKAIVMATEDFKPGMDHNVALNKGKELDKYGEGIRISDESWNIVEKNGGKKMEPYVKNKSNETIYYKPEGRDKATGKDLNPGYDASCAYPIGPNSDLYAPVDGVNTSAVDYGEVFKVPDFRRVEINSRGVPDLINWIDITPRIGEISAPDRGWYDLRDNPAKSKPAWYQFWK